MIVFYVRPTTTPKAPLTTAETAQLVAQARAGWARRPENPPATHLFVSAALALPADYAPAGLVVRPVRIAPAGCLGVGVLEDGEA